ncbi:putative MFS-type transporter YcaD [Jannaschia seosinensis]|uniref:Putative MFS-type transporter YcaD n=1 Tax=Jannaschia seosinensis TaxID=313367 RepID=A0A0M7BB73_9RHOB|nr:MFS transporter [Jannaschia seosinensis]CUH40037.1 putative MFS-type transporter YcaD [Jannaschia seosinensis]
MLIVIRNSWALLIGITLLMIGNGIQGTLLGVRGALEGFSTGAMSIVMSAYFAGFLLGSQFVPDLIRKVGHVRVFAALGSLASAGLILYPALTHPVAWVGLRLLLGFCFCGVYIVSESWLNNTTTNETRGRALSLYLIAQMVGIVVAQAIFAWGDADDYLLFVIVSVLVSLAFAPILLSATPVPPFATSKPMSFRKLYNTSPLGFVGVFLLGAVFSAIFGMAGVFGAAAQLTPAQIALFVSAVYFGGLVLQYPIGWASDRLDRRKMVIVGSVLGAAGCGLGLTGIGGTTGLMVAAFVIGGMANPLYALLLAYTNDYLEADDMASASARLLFVNGLGAIGGPLLTGWLMGVMGAGGFFVFIGVLMIALALYAFWRTFQRAAQSTDETGAYIAVSPLTITPVTMETYAEEYEHSSEEAAAEAEAKVAAE